MKSKKISEMSNEELLKNEKVIKTITALFGGTLLFLFIITIFLNIIKKEFNPLTIIPIALFSIFIININSLKEIKKEKEKRNLN